MINQLVDKHINANNYEMKVKFVYPEVKDNKMSFQDLKAGDTFTIADPKNSKAEVYMKLGKGKNDASTQDTVVLSEGRLASFYDLKREAITQDQLFVYKVDAEMSIIIDN